jgi:hypothetical protein
MVRTPGPGGDNHRGWPRGYGGDDGGCWSDNRHRAVTAGGCHLLGRVNHAFADAVLLQGDQSLWAKVERYAARVHRADDEFIAETGACHIHQVVAGDRLSSRLLIELRDGSGAGGRLPLISPVLRTTDEIPSNRTNAGADQGILTAMLFAADDCAGNGTHRAANNRASGRVVLVVVWRRLVNVLLCACTAEWDEHADGGERRSQDSKSARLLKLQESHILSCSVSLSKRRQNVGVVRILALILIGKVGHNSTGFTAGELAEFDAKKQADITPASDATG